MTSTAFSEVAPSAADRSLIEGGLAGQRRALATTITLLESSCRDHQVRALRILNALLLHSGNAIRVGISGVSGAGKSTFIEAMGTWLTDRGRRVVVLAVDPSSSVSGRSILGDKTRMELLCQREEAFIRPSPTAGSLGGVAEKTRESMLVREAAGFHVIVVETVGAGQSETTVAGMVDMFCLLQRPNAGDDLQAIRKGIVELADLVLINKSDIDPRAAAIPQAQWKRALGALRPASPNRQPPVLTMSALRNDGVAAFWKEIDTCRTALAATGEFVAQRRQQSLEWMWQLIDGGLHRLFHLHPTVGRELPALTRAVIEGHSTPAIAARCLLDVLELSPDERA